MYHLKSSYFDLVVDLSKLKKQDRDSIAEFMEDRMNAYHITYPSDFAIEVAELMSNKGRKYLKTLPVNVRSEDCIELYLRCLRKFKKQAVPRIPPNTQRLLRAVNSPKDFGRIVDDLTLQQDGIGLSYLYDITEKPKIAFCTSKNHLNKRLGLALLDLGAEFIGKRKIVDTLDLIQKEAKKARSMAEERERAINQDSKYRF